MNELVLYCQQQNNRIMANVEKKSNFCSSATENTYANIRETPGNVLLEHF